MTIGRGPLRRIPVVLLGLGGVGRSFLRQVVHCREMHCRRYRVNLEIKAVADSTGFWSPVPADDGELVDLVTAKDGGRPLADNSEGVTGASQELVREIFEPGDTLVDCTASADTHPSLKLALSRGGKIVLANKKPLCTDIGTWRILTADPARSRWEATVGAGLPVITTVARLNYSGDRIYRISGTLSGTMGFLMTGLQEGKALSQLVRDARSRGYTEPDPREDLKGADLARKALILSRQIGWEMSLDDVAVESLYPREMDSLSREQFLDSLESLDEEYASKTTESLQNNQVLRVAVTLQDGQCRVGLSRVNRDTPLGALKGNDNLLEVYSQWYQPSPLVIQGRGAGVEATAAGVLSDVMELAFTQDRRF